MCYKFTARVCDWSPRKIIPANLTGDKRFNKRLVSQMSFDKFEFMPLTKVFEFFCTGTGNKPLLHISESPVWTANSCADTCRQIQAITLITAKPFKSLLVLCCVCISST